MAASQLLMSDNTFHIASFPASAANCWAVLPGLLLHMKFSNIYSVIIFVATIAPMTGNADVAPAVVAAVVAVVAVVTVSAVGYLYGAAVAAPGNTAGNTPG